MSQQRERALSIEEGPVRDAFIEKLQAFHDKRGTVLDPAPKVGQHRVDLRKLYERVTEEGGYDVVSDTKTHKLMWRMLVQDLGLGGPNVPTLPFTLKTAYYKNLAAFEIVEFHKKEPPPKDILEDLTARGGDLLNRTRENYLRPVARDDGPSGEDEPTPDKDKMDVDEPNSIRASRGLRHAPPQRQLFQSETPLQRSSRQSSGHQGSPGAVTNGNFAGSTLSSALASYEPRQQLPLTLRPVTTPANNFEGFKTWQKQLRNQALARMAKPPKNINKPGMMLPGTGFPGPMIYARTLLALQSGILAEQEYSLHHLVKISHERGDKYRFDSFPGLAEALIEKVLDVGPLMLGTQFTIVYNDDDVKENEDALDGINGTRGLIERLRSLTTDVPTDKMQTENYAVRLNLVSEATLVMRNMVMLEENAVYLARLPSARDLLVVLLNLPERLVPAELQNYALEITEQLIRYYPLTPDDALFQSVVKFLRSNDRGIILTAMRGLSRMGVMLNQFPRLDAVPFQIIQRISDWVLIEDEELQHACLDFLYLYTASADNVELLLQHSNLTGLVDHFSRLLLHGAKVYDLKPPPSVPSKPSVSSTPTPSPASGDDLSIPEIPQDLIDQLLVFDEPERSSQWLRCCFREDPSGEITQIALWHAYQKPFSPYATQRPLLPAKDFITNVSTTFANANAQVMHEPDLPPRFVIRGIVPRTVPLDPRSREYMRCLWHLDGDKECGDFALWPKHLYEHVVQKHLGVTKDEEGHYDFTTQPETKYKCRWAGCDRFDPPGSGAAAFVIGMHFKTHLPDQSGQSFQRGKHNTTSDAGQQADNAAVVTSWQTRNTLVDEHQDAAGLPLMSVLVLRNLARNLPRTSSATKAGRDVVSEVFAPVRDRLYFVMAYNISLREYLTVLTNLIDRAAAQQQKQQEGQQAQPVQPHEERAYGQTNFFTAAAESRAA